MTFLTIKQAAEMLTVHPNTIRNWMKSGILKQYQVERGYRVLLKSEDLDKALEHRNTLKDEEGEKVTE